MYPQHSSWSSALISDNIVSEELDSETTSNSGTALH